MKITKIRNVKTPRRGTDGSAGIDFFVPDDYPNSLRSIEPGEKLTQFLLIPVDHSMVQVVDHNDLFEEETDRGAGGFGSTGVQ